MEVEAQVRVNNVNEFLNGCGIKKADQAPRPQFELFDPVLISLLELEHTKFSSLFGKVLWKIPFKIDNVSEFVYIDQEEVSEIYYDTPNFELLRRNMWLKFSNVKGWSLKERVWKQLTTHANY